MGALLLLVLLADLPDPRPVVASHRACKYEKRAEACAEALALYPAYLSRAPADSKMHYFYAELLWDQHRFAEAAQHYREAAADQSAPFSEAAAYAAVLARREMLGAHFDALVRLAPQRRHDGNPWPLPVEAQAFVDAADFYLVHHPRGLHAGAVALSAAFEYFNADDLDQAERRAKWVLEHAPETETLKGLLEDIAWQRQQPPEPPPVQTIGRPETIGEPQTIGGGGEEEDDDEGCGVTFEES